jgi:uncharacterized membrane protein YgcG
MGGSRATGKSRDGDLSPTRALQGPIPATPMTQSRGSTGVARNQETPMPTDTYTLIGLGVAAIVVLWLVFSMMRKMFGLVLILVLAAGAWYVWNNTEAQRAVMNVLNI